MIVENASISFPSNVKDTWIMPEVFDPDFIINFQSDKDLYEIVSDFGKEFEKVITWWRGQMGQTEKYYIEIGSDHAYDMGLTPYPYELVIAGKLREYDDNAQKKHKEFARSVVKFLEGKGCTVRFSATFSLDDG